MTDHIPVITVDGPSGAGKGTLCALIAETLGFRLLDSGALYRLLAYAASQHSIAPENEEGLVTLAAHLDVQFLTASDRKIQIVLESEDVTENIRTEDVAAFASKVAAITRVREALLRRQRAFKIAPGLVADGRDMGTVVFPEADLKIFLTASAEERADRRVKQLKDKGIDANISSILESIRERDERDSKRSVAPLAPAQDAINIDTTGIGIDAVFTKVMTLVKGCAFFDSRSF